MLDAMKSRYTVKKYTGEKIDSKVIDELKEILRLSPSSINAQPWRFVFVENEEVKSKLAESSKFNDEKILKSDVLVVFQVKKEERFMDDAPTYIPDRVYDYFKTEVTKRPGGYHTWATNQVYIAMGVLLAACAAMNVDSTPMEGIVKEEYDKIVNDNNDFVTTAVVSLGVAAEDDFNHPSKTEKSRLPLDEVIKEIK